MDYINFTPCPLEMEVPDALLVVLVVLVVAMIFRVIHPVDQYESGRVPVLPIEVWEKVFQNSAAKDAWNFRLVCSDWRKEMDDHYDKWTVRLDQNSPFLQHILQLTVKEATILDLRSPVDMDDEEGTPRLFKHPELLERLSIRYKHQSCLENAMFLLNSCRKTIKHLHLATGSRNEDYEIFDSVHNLYANNGLEFTNLESLNLRFRHSPPHLIQELTALFKVMTGRSTMSKMKSLTVFVTDDLCIDVLFSTILAFIARNGTNLEELKCLLTQKYLEDVIEEPAQAQLPAIDLALLRQVRRLQKVKIHCEGNENLQIPFETLLEAQTNLKDLELSEDIHISLQSLRRVCYNNQNTLTEIKLHCLDFHFNIDLAIFAGCVHLKVLHLWRMNEDDDEYQGHPVLQNARSLPVGIQELSLENWFIQSDDMMNLFIGHPELVDIVLVRSGSDGSNGVTALVFALFVINRNSSNKLKYMGIDGFNCSTAGDLAALNAIVGGLKPEWEHRQDFGNVGIDEKDHGRGWRFVGLGDLINGNLLNSLKSQDSYFFTPKV